jgi:hypothetical protein
MRIYNSHPTRLINTILMVIFVSIQKNGPYTCVNTRPTPVSKSHATTIPEHLIEQPTPLRTDLGTDPVPFGKNPADARRTSNLASEQYLASRIASKPVRLHPWQTMQTAISLKTNPTAKVTRPTPRVVAAVARRRRRTRSPRKSLAASVSSRHAHSADSSDSKTNRFRLSRLPCLILHTWNAGTRPRVHFPRVTATPSPVPERRSHQPTQSTPLTRQPACRTA